MIFESRFPLPPVPSTDVFNYIFRHGRRSYPWRRVLYRDDKAGETLTLAELEEKSRRFADVMRSEYDIQPKDVVSILAKDRVCTVEYFHSLPFLTSTDSISHRLLCGAGCRSHCGSHPRTTGNVRGGYRHSTARIARQAAHH